MVGVGKAGRVDEIPRKEELVVQRLSSDIPEIRPFGSEMTIRSSFHFAIFSFMDILNFYQSATAISVPPRNFRCSVGNFLTTSF